MNVLDDEACAGEDGRTYPRSSGNDADGISKSFHVRREISVEIGARVRQPEQSLPQSTIRGQQGIVRWGEERRVSPKLRFIR